MNNYTYILPNEDDKFDDLEDKVAIVVNLYYLEEINYYLHYLDGISDNIDVYIFTSRDDVYSVLEKHYMNYNNFYIKKKDNRGRDVSALLVCFREYVGRYEYVCFIHDKKASEDHLNKDVALWIDNMWESLLHSDEYITSVINLMKTTNIGYVCPPNPIGEYLPEWYSANWEKNFDNVVALTKRLHLQVRIERTELPLSLGTVFWAKVDALKKIFDYEWHYDDFPEEPLPKDATISHAIERVLPYVALDAGYEVANATCSDYASKLLERAQNYFTKCFALCKEDYYVNNMAQLLRVRDEEVKAVELFENNQYVYIYGAGDLGTRLLMRLKRAGYFPDGIVVSDGYRENESIQGIPVLELGELERNSSIAFLVAVTYSLQKEVIENLKKYGFENSYFFFES